jgi:hypothetical protein
MSFTGYNFRSREDALPFAVSQDKGPDFIFAQDLAIRLNAYVAFGYI